MKQLKFVTSISAITFSLLLAGCSSSSDDNTNANGGITTPDTDLPNTDLPNTDLPNTDLPNTDLPNTDLPNTDLPNTDDGTGALNGSDYNYIEYSFDDELSSIFDKFDYLISSFSKIEKGKVVNITEKIILPSAGGSSDYESNSSKTSVLGKNFQSLYVDEKTLEANSIFNKNFFTYTYKDDDSIETAILKYDVSYVDLSGKAISDIKYRTPLYLISGNSSAVFPQGSTCGMVSDAVSSKTVYTVELDEPTDYNSVQEWYDDFYFAPGTGPFSIVSEMVGTDNMTSVYRVTDGDIKAEVALIYWKGKYYRADYFPANATGNIADFSKECNTYNKLAFDFIIDKVKSAYNVK